MNLGAFAWPGAVTIIVCFALLLFQKSIRSLLARTYKIRTIGFEVAAGAQDTSKSEVGPSVANDLARQHDDPLLVKREDSIRTELGLGADQTPKETKLLGMVAAHSIALQFEKTYQAIFGSQLSALVIINAAPGGVQFGDIQDLYNQAAAQHKAFYETYNGEQWLAYMERESLSTRKDDRADHTPKETELLGMVAAHSIALQFEKTYQAIFGSQLSALVIINAAPGGVQFGDIQDLYNQAAAQHKAFYETYNGEQWLAYMERESLSTRKDDRIHITLEGTAFLKYIIHRGYTLDKFG